MSASGHRASSPGAKGMICVPKHAKTFTLSHGKVLTRKGNSGWGQDSRYLLFLVVPLQSAERGRARLAAGSGSSHLSRKAESPGNRTFS